MSTRILGSLSALVRWVHASVLSAPEIAGSLFASVSAPMPQRPLDQISPIEIAFIVTFLVISLGLHEAAHAWVANECGDSTAKDLGRITVNPIAHIDPVLTIILPLVLILLHLPAFGGAKPVPVDYHRLRHPLRDMMLVALAGPATNFALAFVFFLGWKCAVYVGHYDPDALLPNVLFHSLNFNVMLAVFNMLPIPPLDGSRVMTWLLPAPIRAGYQSLERIGLFLVIAVMRFVPGVDELVYSSMTQVGRFIDLSTGGVW